jgi:hypothetical protein
MREPPVTLTRAAPASQRQWRGECEGRRPTATLTRADDINKKLVAPIVEALRSSAVDRLPTHQKCCRNITMYVNCAKLLDDSIAHRKRINASRAAKNAAEGPEMWLTGITRSAGFLEFAPLSIDCVEKLRSLTAAFADGGICCGGDCQRGGVGSRHLMWRRVRLGLGPASPIS